MFDPANWHLGCAGQGDFRLASLLGLRILPWVSLVVVKRVVDLHSEINQRVNCRSVWLLDDAGQEPRELRWAFQ